MIRDIPIDEHVVRGGDSPFEECVVDSTILAQMTRCISRPLETDDANNRKVFSWRGRGVCLLKFGQNFPREVWKSFINVAALVMVAGASAIGLLNAPFIDRDKLLEGCIGAPLAVVGGTMVRPVAFILDQAKLLLGAVIHPNIAIRELR